MQPLISRTVKKIIFTIIFFLTFSRAFAQIQDGLYTFTSYSFPYNGDGVSCYIIIKKDRFILFSLLPSPNSSKPIFQLHYFGTGNFSIEKKTVILHFTSDGNNILLPYVNDSLQVVFSTNTSNRSNSIKLNVHSKSNPEAEATLQVETPNKIYHFNTKNDSLMIELPDNTIITSIKLFLITYDYRILPYDYHFNEFRYNYYLNDSNVVVRYIKESEFKFKIRAKRSAGFLFQSNGSLLKTEENAVSSLKEQAAHNKNLKRIIEFLEK